ncbi:MAG: 4-hydroxyphenylacetate 3-hydroxylase [Proteobacteria bacterium]|nr:4-hydroxyphenylacetate 3-hydroxylase [Pseudomonadota bacterium]
MPARSGEAYLRGLAEPRALWVDGERVSSVVDHPALSGAARTIASVYDLQLDQADICLMPDPETGEPIGLSHIIPRSKEDLHRRHRCLDAISDLTAGSMGRTPDYLNVTFAGFAGDAAAWRAFGNEEGAERLIAYQKHLRRADLSLTHAIVSPAADKALGDMSRPGDEITLRKICDTDGGILVRGSRALATLAPFADEIAIYPRVPLPVGSEAYALCFCIPMSTPGLKFICRDSLSEQTTPFDHPLSSRFDEQDAFVIFDDVEVPRDRVFIDGNLGVFNSVMQTTWMPNIMQQTMIRAAVKLDFAWGLARRMAKTVNAADGATEQMLGEIWSYAEFARAAIIAAEAGAFEHADGFWIPDVKPLYALRCMLPSWFPRVNEIISLIGSHFMLATPRAAQFKDPELRPLLDAYLSGAGEVDATERAAVFRLAWDFVGTGLGSRNAQYERFYLASGARNLQRAFTVADKDRADRLVDRFLPD